MGDYTGIATRLKVKKDAPEEVVNYLNTLYGLGTFSQERGEVQAAVRAGVGDSEEFDKMYYMLHVSSAYFEGWNSRSCGEKPDYRLYESFSSCKYPDINMVLSFLKRIEKYLVLSPGDILVRSIFEQSVAERVIYLGDSGLQIGEGMRYRHNHGWIIDSSHPFNLGSPGSKYKEDIEFIPPWNMTELQTLLEKESKRL